MNNLDARRAVAVAACAGMLALGWQPVSAAEPQLPFHGEYVWQLEQVPVAEGDCTHPLPPGLSYLWLSKVPGTGSATHLGSVAYYVEFCVFGVLTDPGAPPPGNGIAMGWAPAVETWTAANGDQLRVWGELIGFIGTPGTPGFMFVVALSFLDGGTGRFAHARGEATALIDPVAQTAVYDGWIRYGKKAK